jgi:type 1 fimbria pilin
MKRKNSITIGVLIFSLILAGHALAHTPLCSCYDNADGTITCEGGFSDGSSAAGVRMRVEKRAGGALLQGKMDENSEYTFKKPDGDYKVVFDAGEGHVVEVDGGEIFE